MNITKHSRRPALTVALAAGAILATAAGASSAYGAKQVWWTNFASYPNFPYNAPGLDAAIGRAGIDGSNPTTVINKATTSYVTGATVDLWSGRLFYVRRSGEIVKANLDGSDPQVILSGSAVVPPGGAAWDLTYARKTDSLYWATTVNPNASTIRTARADGSSPSTLFSVTGALTYSLAVVPELDRVYWTNNGNVPVGEAIWYGNLDGTGSRQVITTDCAGGLGYASAIAVDPARGRMFFQVGPSTYTYPYVMHKSSLDGTGCVTGAAMYLAETDDSIAVDTDGNQLVTGNYGSSRGPEGLWKMDISTLAAPGSAILPAGPTSLNPSRPFIVEPPKPIGASASLSTSGSTVGATLTLAAVQDTFAPDEPGIRVFRGVTTKSVAWYRDGVAIPGETGSTYIATQTGTYKAVISASNIAGSVDTTSNEVTISAQAEPRPTPAPGPAPTPSNAFTAVAAAGPSGTVASVARVPRAGKVRQVVTRLSGGTRVAVCSTPAKAAKGAGRVRLACTVNPSTRAAQATGRVRVRVRITFTPTGGTARTVTRYAWLPSLKPPVTG